MKRFNFRFVASLLWVQNSHHKHGVFLHTLLVTYHLLRFKQYRMVVAGLLHDIGKPFVAFQDSSDLKKSYLSYSFKNHEEASYRIVKKCSFISDYTKNIVRYHYIIRDMQKSLEKGYLGRYNRLSKIWETLAADLKDDLLIFLKCDDLGKQ